MAAGAGLAIGATFAAGGTAQAADFTVTNTNPDGPGSLRDAINQANANNNAPAVVDRVLFQSGVSGTINLNPDPNYYGDLGVDEALEIVGPGADTLTVSGNADSRIFDVYTADGEDVTISGLRIIQGNVKYGFGGNIRSSGADLTISRSQVRTGTAIFGGGIMSDGNLTIADSTISGNVASLLGGGIASGYGPSGDQVVRITGSTINNNTAGAKYDTGPSQAAVSSDREIGGGGAILVPDSIVENSTFTGNTTPGNGGAILTANYDAPTSLRVRSATISGNEAGAGGGIYSQTYQGQGTPPPNATIENSIIAGNEADGAAQGHDLGGGPFSTAFVLIQRPAGASFTETVAGSNILGIDPRLAAPGDNGGPTRTMALLDGSPAIDNGRTPAGETTDQRGEPRPVDLSGYPNNGAAGADGADMGAFERQRPAPEGECRGQAATVGLEPAGEITFGTPGRDVIVGNGATNEIRGRGGDDLICGLGSRDVLRGGPGADIVLGQDGNDNVFGDQDNDRLIGGLGNDKLNGATGNDVVIGNPGQDRLTGSAGNDRLEGGDDNDVLLGASGVDILVGGRGNDRLNGGEGIDRLGGGEGRDQEIQ